MLLMAMRGSVEMQHESMDGVAVQHVTTGGSAELSCHRRWQYPVTGGTGEQHFRTLQGEAVQFPTTGGSDQLQ